MFPLQSSILIVDDSPVYLEMLESLLRELGFNNVTSATDGKKGLETLEAMKDTPNAIQLVFIDCVMPHVSGIEFIERVRSHATLSKLPIIIDSSPSEKDVFLQALQKGANSFLEKPIIKSALEKCLKSVWQHCQSDKDKK